MPRIPNVDQGVNDGEIIVFGDEGVQVIETVGHTSNQVNFWFKNSNILTQCLVRFSIWENIQWTNFLFSNMGYITKYDEIELIVIDYIK